MRKALAQSKRARALELWENGGPDITPVMIAQRLGVRPSQVNAWLRAAGVSHEDRVDRYKMLRAWGRGKST